jgi:hypothetical protein
MSADGLSRASACSFATPRAGGPAHPARTQPVPTAAAGRASRVAAGPCHRAQAYPVGPMGGLQDDRRARALAVVGGGVDTVHRFKSSYIETRWKITPHAARTGAA